MLLALTVRVVDLLKVDEFIGVQPITGPVSTAYIIDTTNQTESTTAIAKTIVVEATTRRLNAAFTDEAFQDIQTYDHINLEVELISALSIELADEINLEWISTLDKVAHEKQVPSYATKLITVIDDELLSIAERNNRGPGNWIVTSIQMIKRMGLEAIDIQKQNSPLIFDPDYGSLQMGRTFTFMGMFKEHTKVFFSPYLKDNEALIGYKGESVIDTAVLYTPYVPLMMSTSVINHLTYASEQRFMTRYGSYIGENASNYYTKLTFGVSQTSSN